MGASSPSLSLSLPSEPAEEFADPLEEDWESVFAEPWESAPLVSLCSFCPAWVAADES